MKHDKNIYLLHLTIVTITIAPKIADIIETIIKVSGHPSSVAFSKKQQTIFDGNLYENFFM